MEDENAVPDVQTAVFMSVISAITESMPIHQRAGVAARLLASAKHFSEKAVDKNGQAVAAILSAMAETVRGNYDDGAEILGLHQKPKKP